MTNKEIIKADWLRSEIEKLNGMIDKTKYRSPKNMNKARYALGGNIVLTSIITRYKEELKVLTGE